MPLLFSYGTLREPKVQRSVFGRTLVGRDASLLGFKKALTRVDDPDFVKESGKAMHSILIPTKDQDARVPGIALEVTVAELVLVDEYEPTGYKRVVALLATGQEAWVYIDAAYSGGGKQTCNTTD